MGRVGDGLPISTKEMNTAKFYTSGIHRCKIRGRDIAVPHPDISRGKGLSVWKFRTRVNQSAGYSLIICRGCDQTVAVVV